MDSKYIVTRLKSSLYKYPTADQLRNRLNNLDQNQKHQILTNLKMELCKECNNDIYEPLFELIYRMPIAS